MGDPGSRLWIFDTLPAEVSQSFELVDFQEEIKPLPPVVFTLDDAIRLACNYNPDLQAAQQRVCIADALLERARSEFYPPWASRKHTA